MINTAADMMSHQQQLLSTTPAEENQNNNNDSIELSMNDYFRSLYMTDLANLLLVIHSATNWVIFIRRRNPHHKKPAQQQAMSTASTTMMIVRQSTIDRQPNRPPIQSDSIQPPRRRSSANDIVGSSNANTKLCSSINRKRSCLTSDKLPTSLVSRRKSSLSLIVTTNNRSGDIEALL